MHRLPGPRDRGVGGQGRDYQVTEGPGLHRLPGP